MIGRTLSHYTLVSELGRGGMGVVYRAVDVTLGREVAIKVLLPEFVADPERRRRFLQEAKAVSWLRMAAAQGFPCDPFYLGDPNLSGLHGDPDFEAFMIDLKAQWERLRAEAARHS